MEKFLKVAMPLMQRARNSQLVDGMKNSVKAALAKKNNRKKNKLNKK